MVASGNWLIPHRGSELYSDKPPAFMAMQAARIELTGNWRIAFLLPSLLAALGTLWLVYDLARRLWDHRTGLYAAVAAAHGLPVRLSGQARADRPNGHVLHHAGELRACCAISCSVRIGARTGSVVSPAGLGVITKGVGVLALLMFLPYIFARCAHWKFVASTSRASLRWLGGGLAFLAAIALWLGPLLLVVGRNPAPEYRTYLHDILFRQTAARYTDSWDHQQAHWYYLGVIATGWLPLWLTWFGTVPAWWSRLRARDARFLLPLAWVVLVIVFFSIPAGKRDMYIMPALPWVALCCAPFLGDIVQRRWFRILAAALLVVLGVGFLGGGLWAESGRWQLAQELAVQRGFDDGGAALWRLLVALGAWMLACAGYFRLIHAAKGLLAGLAGLWLLWGFWACPLLNDSSSARSLMRQVGSMIGPQAELGMVAWKEQNLLFADRPVTDFGFVKPWREQLGAAIRWQEAAPAQRWIFVLANAMAPCIDQRGARYVGHANRREWWLFRADAVVEACRGGAVPLSKSADRSDPDSD